MGIVRQALAIFFVITISIANADTFARSVLSPAAKDIPETDVSDGQFANTVWESVNAKHKLEDFSESILLFSEESIGSDKIFVKVCH